VADGEQLVTDRIEGIVGEMLGRRAPPIESGAAKPGNRSGPIIVLTYAHAGAEYLKRALSTSSELACTAGTGFVPLCDRAAATWQALGSGNTELSVLAIKTVRMLADAMTTVIRAETGAKRWCETVFAAPATAETFLRIFPEAMFVCLHRSLEGVLAEGIQAYPWGLGGSPFWPYPGGHPDNVPTTIASYWAAHTKSLLSFQTKYDKSCIRVSYEDLMSNPNYHLLEIFRWLGVNSPNLTLINDFTKLPHHVHQEKATRLVCPNFTEGIPTQLSTEIDDLQVRLGWSTTKIARSSETERW